MLIATRLRPKQNKAWAALLLLFVALLVVGCAAQPAVPFEPTSQLDYHNGYWVTKYKDPGQLLSLTVINDMHVDSATNQVTVYAQSRLFGQVIAPTQVGPGECSESFGETVCFHPDAVYLNGSGEELMVADGTGSWWVKHAWVLGGKGYDNCELRPAETYDRCLYAEGKLMEDGLTMKVGGINKDGAEVFNTRLPVFNDGDVSYLVTRFAPVNADPAVGELNLTPTVQFALTFDCQEKASAFDNRVRSCPEFVR